MKFRKSEVLRMSKNKDNQLDKAFRIKRNKHVSNEKVTFTKEYSRAVISNLILKVSLTLFTVFIAGLVSFVCLKGPIKTNNAYIVPEIEKSFKISDKVIVTESQDSIAARLKESVITPKGIMTGTIVAGPYGAIYGTDGDYTIEDGNFKASSNLDLNQKHEKFLNNEYVVKCSAGACEKGKDYLVKANKMKGKIK